MKGKNNFISIKTKLTIYFLLIVIIPVCIITLNFKHSAEKLIEKKTTDFLMEISKQSDERIEGFMNDIEKSSLLIAYNDDVQTYMKQGGVNEEIHSRTLLEESILSKNHTYSIYIYSFKSPNNLYMTSSGPINYNYSPLKEKWFAKLLNSKTPFSITDSHKDMQVRDSDRMVVTAGRKIYDMSNGKLIGMIVYNINLNFVDSICGNILKSRNANLCIINKENSITYDADFRNVGLKLQYLMPIAADKLNKENGEFILNDYKNNKYIVTYNSFNNVAWKIILYIPFDSVSAESSLFMKSLLIMIIILLIFVIIASVIISSSISNPIRRLIKSMKRVETGDFDNVSYINSNDEIGLLSESFNTMTHELKNYIEKIYDEEKLKNEAEMAALQAQINPHFLFNTLNSIKWIAAMQKSNKIVELMEALISMLRFATSKVGDMVTIDEEIENVKNYITIQRMRYCSLMEVKFFIEGEIGICKIPKYTIQPIVENAILHGLPQDDAVGLIQIYIRQQGDNILITVKDNGKGMDEATIRDVTSLISSKEGKFNNIGISNVNSRLKMHFGKDYGLSFESVLDKGTEFNMLVPLIR